jgi:hypothetical protein
MYNYTYKMNIPTNIPYRINPTIQDYISKSVIYTFTDKDIHLDNENNILYRFPYSKNTYWTNFKYTCYDNITNEYKNLNIGIELTTSDGYKCCIKNMENVEDKNWCDTVWPIPSIYTEGSDASINFKIKQSANDNTRFHIVISLLGFIDIFPNVSKYILLLMDNTFKFVFNKYDEDDTNGTIFDFEINKYIDDNTDNASIISLICKY